MLILMILAQLSTILSPYALMPDLYLLLSTFFDVDKYYTDFFLIIII